MVQNEALGTGKTASVVEKDGSEKENREPEDDEWDWDRWHKHFQDIDEHEPLVSLLKSQLSRTVLMEDYEDAARIKVAIAAAATNDSGGRVISHLNKAIEGERYNDAAFLRDKAGAGLVGWWDGTSKDGNDPHGLIICITPEHGRYVARSYSPRYFPSLDDNELGILPFMKTFFFAKGDPSATTFTVIWVSELCEGLKIN